MDNSSGPAKVDLLITGLNPTNNSQRGQTATTLLAPATESFSYDDDGNMPSDGLWNYTRDADSSGTRTPAPRVRNSPQGRGGGREQNRLVAATSSPWGRVELKYDAFSRRVRIIEKAPSTLAVEADKQLIWDGLDIVQQYEVIGNQIRCYYGNGETREQPGAAPYEYFYTRDHLGNIREVVAKYNGVVLARYDYTPYGIRTKLSGTVDCDFGFTGHYTNDRSGLVLAPYRAYEPKLGRWISRDPLGETGDVNLFRYANSNPISKLDRLGLIPGCTNRNALPQYHQIDYTRFSDDDVKAELSSVQDVLDTLEWVCQAGTEAEKRAAYKENITRAADAGTALEEGFTTKKKGREYLLVMGELFTYWKPNCTQEALVRLKWEQEIWNTEAMCSSNRLRLIEYIHFLNEMLWRKEGSHGRPQK